MKNISKIILVAVCFLLSATTLVSAIGYSTTVNLYEKDPTTWQIVPGGAYGKFMFEVKSIKYLGSPVIIPSFVALGYGLNPLTNYTVVCYPSENWPHAQYLGTDISNEDGYLQIRGMYSERPDYKVWIVLASDFDAVNQVFIGWHPTEYLFEGATF